MKLYFSVLLALTFSGHASAALLYDSWLESSIPAIFSVDHTKISLEWPIDPINLEQHSGFATLRIGYSLNEVEDEEKLNYGNHNAIDLVSLVGSGVPVFAPVSGFVFVLSHFDLDSKEYDYFKDVWLFDSRSNAIIRMSHVKPDERIIKPRTLYPILEGDMVGVLADIPEALATVAKPHVHLELIEYGKQALNPALYLSGFRDVRPPKIEDLFVNSNRSLVFGFSDKTNHGEYNGPPHAVSIDIFRGNVAIAFARNCRIQQKISELKSDEPALFLDLLRMSSEAVELPGFGARNTELNPEHIYWIQLDGLSESVCDDLEGMSRLSEFMSYELRFDVRAEDAFGNRSQREFMLNRSEETE